MTKSTITRERLEALANAEYCKSNPGAWLLSVREVNELARMALAATDSSESVELPLDYLQGHKDGLEWAARLAEANHPDTGDWLYDDPIELAKAIRKGPDMPPAQPVAYSEPVAWTDEEELRDVNVAGIGYLFGIDREANKFSDPRRQIMLYRHAQPAPVVPDGYVMVPKEPTAEMILSAMRDNETGEVAEIYELMLAAAPQSPGSEPATVPGKWIPVSERMPESNGMYFGWDGKRVLEVYCFFGGFSANQFIHGEITHWMPLPAAPQEVNHG
ncbi:DUF551 domain-containing protein [Klebsiella pneumoniae]|nr:DUF551 domain-containing protein [Klebsiella pneumoniae]